MDRNFVDRMIEAAALLCLAAAVVLLALSARAPEAGGSLADLRAQTLPAEELARYRILLREARTLVDSNGSAGGLLEELIEAYPGRHEVWALAGRFHEDQRRQGEALVAYARAVRLMPGYLDPLSGLYLGGRIEALTRSVMDHMEDLRAEGTLDSEERELLKTAYYIKRRLAGGCE